MTHKEPLQELRAIGNPKIAEHSQRFFKTGEGEYGEGDLFLGIRVPEVRKIAKKFNKLSLPETEKLLHSKYHEARLCALVILVNLCKKAEQDLHTSVYELYLANTSYINNWDLVDISAQHIVGSYLLERDRKVLHQLAESEDLWERRIAIMSTLFFIRHNDFDTTIEIAEQLLEDDHDLIHKAVGWMLREVGKREIKREQAFLDKHIRSMPRTMLRYAIEKFPETKRKEYLEM